MQFTLRRMLCVITGIAIAIIGIPIFGIAATITALTIPSAGFLAYSKLPTERRNASIRIALIGTTMLALYVGTFLSFRVVRTFPYSLAHPDDPHSHLVIFSMTPAAQQFARIAYSPLITIIPGHCAYPTGEEMEFLNRDPFSGERHVIYW